MIFSREHVGPHRASSCAIPKPKPELVHNRWVGKARDPKRYQWPLNLKPGRYADVKHLTERNARPLQKKAQVCMPLSERLEQQKQFRRKRLQRERAGGAR